MSTSPTCIVAYTGEHDRFRPLDAAPSNLTAHWGPPHPLRFRCFLPLRRGRGLPPANLVVRRRCRRPVQRPAGPESAR